MVCAANQHSGALPLLILQNFCYRLEMLKLKSKRSAAKGTSAVTKLAKMQASIIALNDEDLLDLGDIFSGKTPMFITDIAATELKRRNLSLEPHSSD